MKTKYILLGNENSDSVKYAKERNMPSADTFTSPVDLYNPTRDVMSLKNGGWDKLEIHNLITKEIYSKTNSKIIN